MFTREYNKPNNKRKTDLIIAPKTLSVNEDTCTWLLSNLSDHKPLQLLSPVVVYLDSCNIFPTMAARLSSSVKNFKLFNKNAI